MLLRLLMGETPVDSSIQGEVMIEFLELKGDEIVLDVASANWRNGFVLQIISLNNLVRRSLNVFVNNYPS